MAETGANVSPAIAMNDMEHVLTMQITHGHGEEFENWNATHD